MNKRFIIYDVTEPDSTFAKLPEDVIPFSASPAVRHCLGCFGCWVKTPGQCVMHDRCLMTPAALAASNEMIIVSKLVYGGLSPEVKAVFDRSIGYILPFFRIINGEMHHTMRYDNPFKFTVHFYGENIGTSEQELGRRLVRANAVNLGSGSHEVFFHNHPVTLKEVIS